MTRKAAPPSAARSTLDRRRAGILLHPSSLPGGAGNGDLGPDAVRFVDLLASADISVWQMLPLGPTHEDGSPYQCLSSHAGDARLISLDRLVEWGWLKPDTKGPGDDPAVYRRRHLSAAFEGFQAHAPAAERDAFAQFVDGQHHWLEDYALYRALRHAHGDSAWWQWPEELRNREPAALARARDKLADELERQRFEQFVFFRQWFELKAYANQRGVLMFGDMPIFVAHDSSEVWAQREYFAFDDHGNLQTVAGVPPDYFSATGQRWGNPHYRWERMQADDFHWWKERMRTQLGMFDLVRVDHFRGFEAYWEIPAHAETAVDGRWVKAPGDDLFRALHEMFDPLPLVAEDLGVITEEVDALRRRYGLPGMKILQFAFGGGADNPYLPHNHEADTVVYTGTHDNNTTLGWFEEIGDEARRQVYEYLGDPGEPMPWPLIRAACASVARLCIIPMQDVLALGGEHRMNQPGTTQGNWRWRFEWSQVGHDLAGRLRRLVALYGR